ncbi:MAG TPA: 5-oxoprolinase subunit PxpA [Hyphomicrobiaceae bacterium]|nr:5-oxoprolinase subunit PxpA [Hyphomicrobiaceae bacterium]
MRIDLNADMGEGFGPWQMGDDDAMLEIISSANVACGWHAGDPNIMFRIAEKAKAKGIALGAHPSFNDLWGFGRRVIRGDSMAEIERMVAYQIGAMQGMASLAGHKVTFVKAHGALGNLTNAEPEFAEAVGRAIKGVDRSLVYVAMPGLPTERIAEKLGLKAVMEAFADRTYEDDGQLTPRKIAGSVIDDPVIAAERALQMARDQVIVARSGKRIKARIETICVHGDKPSAVAQARRVRDVLEGAGMKVQPFAPAA